MDRVVENVAKEIEVVINMWSGQVKESLRGEQIEQVRRNAYSIRNVMAEKSQELEKVVWTECETLIKTLEKVSSSSSKNISKEAESSLDRNPSDDNSSGGLNVS